MNIFLITDDLGKLFSIRFLWLSAADGQTNPYEAKLPDKASVNTSSQQLSDSYFTVNFTLPISHFAQLTHCVVLGEK